MIVKLQYKDFEPGEFADVKDRSCEETIQLIDTFPWEEQRDHLKVSLTNPSISIEDGQGNFLKLALNYNASFVLHYFDTLHRLYNKSLVSYADAQPYIQQYFSGQPFNANEFHLENTWLQRNLIHFTTQDFHYELTGKRVFGYLLFTSAINFMLTIFFLVLILVVGPGRAPLPFLAVILFLFGGGPNLILFFDYHRYAKGKLLIMSRGNSQFFFGDPENPESFNKQDILAVTEYRSARNSRNPIGGFRWVEILLRGGRSIIIPNLLINEADLENKLYEHPAVTREKIFPLISPSAQSPS